MKKIVISIIVLFSALPVRAGFLKEEAAIIKGGLIVAAGIYATYRLVEALQPYVFPTPGQTAQRMKEKNALELLILRQDFCDCLLKNKGDTDTINGIPKKCSSLANDFIMKAGQEEYKDMVDRFKKLM